MYELLMGLGLAMPAGLNAYIPLLVLGVTARFTTLVTLAPPYDILASDVGLIAIALLLMIELVADKIAFVDHVNDLVQTAVRPTAGAILMLASTGATEEISPALALLLGVLTAGSVHAAKATTRPAVTAATGGLGNPVVSATEDGIAIISSLVAILLPIAVVLTFIIFLVTIFALVRYRRRRHVRSRTTTRT